MSNVTAIAEAARELVVNMDGAQGTTWAELAEDVTADPYPVEVGPTELAALIRVLIEAGWLRD